MEVIQNLIDEKVIKVDISITDYKGFYKLNFDNLKEIIKLSLENKNFYDYLYAIFNYIFITIKLDKHIPFVKQLHLYEIEQVFYIFRKGAKYDIICNHKTIYIKTKVEENNLRYLEEFLNEVFELIRK
jgi:hypothetical protein